MIAQGNAYEFLGAPLTTARGNVTAAVTDQLRRAIVSLDLKPGVVLDKGLICGRLGVSRFPVSEALARLQTEGLVEIQPQRGSAVSLVRLVEVTEYMLIRKALECEALRVLAGHTTAELVAELDDNIAAQRAAADRDDRGSFHGHDLAFHELLFAGMRFARIKATVEAARSNIDRARRLIITPRRLAYSIGEHQAIRDAVVAGDAAEAARVLRAHIDSVMVELFAFARQRPEFFADGGEHATHADSSFPFG